MYIIYIFLLMVCALRACWPRANLSLVIGRVWACDGALVRWCDAMERCHSDPVLRMRMPKPKHRHPFVLFEEHLNMPGQLDEGANDAECRYLEREHHCEVKHTNLRYMRYSVAIEYVSGVFFTNI